MSVFTMAPEALIASILAPEQFGKYMAVGTKKRTCGQAYFFEVSPDKIGSAFHSSENRHQVLPGRFA